MTTDTRLEQRIRVLYAVPVPAQLDRRLEAAMSTVPVRHPRRLRPRLVAGFAVAAILAAAAAVPTFEWFGWYGPFDRLWQISTPVDQSVTADGYRVTIHRAYADRLGVRLAMTVEDLDGRSSGLNVDRAEATDVRGRVYEAWNWYIGRAQVEGRNAMWARFLLPDDGPSGDLQLRVTITSLRVRLPDPLPPGTVAEQMFASVGGAWNFNISVPLTHGSRTVSPAVSTSESGVTIVIKELALEPSGTLVRMAVQGLPAMPGGSVARWTPTTNIEHDGKTLDEFERRVGSDGIVTLEALQSDDLAGHWKITVDGFWSSGPPNRYFGNVVTPVGADAVRAGPWVLEFDVARTP